MAPVLEVADIFRRHGAAFRQAHAGHLGGVERRIMGAITACRRAAFGGHVDQCDECGATRIALIFRYRRRLDRTYSRGAIVDWVPWKRGLAAFGIVMIGTSGLIFALAPTIAEILHGITGGIVTPAIAAISLGLVGRGAMSARTGRNSAFDAAGNALTAGAMGAAGQYISKSAIFFGAAALCVPALISLSLIRSDEIDYARSRNAGVGKSAANFQRIFDLSKNLQLYIFASCTFLFQVADASMLPIISQELAQDKNQPTSLLLAGLIVTPQIIAALLSPWVGYYSEKFGRKPLLLMGFGIRDPAIIGICRK